MRSSPIHALVVGCLSGAMVCACAGQRPAPESPTETRAPADAGLPQLKQTIESLEEPSIRTEEATQEARSVLDALGGVLQMQGDGGVTAE
jgi:hypothetical protein